MKIHFTDEDIQSCYDWYVVNNYMGSGSEPITLEFFFNDVWNEMTDEKRLQMLWMTKNMTE